MIRSQPEAGSADRRRVGNQTGVNNLRVGAITTPGVRLGVNQLARNALRRCGAVIGFSFGLFRGIRLDRGRFGLAVSLGWLGAGLAGKRALNPITRCAHPAGARGRFGLLGFAAAFRRLLGGLVRFQYKDSLHLYK